MRLVGMAAGAVLTCLVFYRNHRNRVYKRKIQDVLQEFDLFFQDKMAVMPDPVCTGCTLYCRAF